ncbi:hypothetical protein [Mucilaginibacter sp. PAMB04168]|uniref:hypothetical protein n=1 Tax=Mucilaginibacter sp. PAMB04168 TaxID=3138567 RepID=UPI0031F62D01
MNKFISTLILIISTIAVKAQTDKGTVFVGGGISYNSQTSKDPTNHSKHINMDLLPTVGVFLGNNWSIGLTPQYSYARDSSFYKYDDYSSKSGHKSKLLGIGLSVRHYWMIIPQLALFPELSGSYLFSVGDAGASAKSYNMNITPNMAFFPTKHIAITFGYGGLRYLHQTNKDTALGTTASYNTFGFNVNQGMILGVNYHFTN